MPAYDQGTLVTVQAEFYSAPPNQGGELTDPTEVTFVAQAPDGSQIGPTAPTRVSTGIYTYEIDTTAYAGGSVLYEFQGTGPCQVVGWRSFIVNPNPIA